MLKDPKMMTFYRMVSGVEKVTMFVPEGVDVNTITPQQAHDLIEGHINDSTCIVDVELMENQYPHQIVPFEFTHNGTSLVDSLANTIYLDDRG